ncbi:hypothetical protein LWI28_003813 [Acer negundo]|uniref:RNase H type-1 domain-containing protein n=1 Tax=Acer negundo TaxID=4023 RepID=A0AAD5NGM3_ACENE|nr:hypothetical protein LWI28_003813 [Acer negundo]
MSNGDSLAARVLKACYFPDSNLLKAELKPTTSFMWKSLMWGKEIIAAGTRWKVGDGSMIRIYKDKWIVRPTSFCHISPPFLGENTTVDMLISASGMWNLGLIKKFFWEDDVAAILSIPNGRSRSSDSLQWHFNQKGSYSVKSGYQVGCSIKSDTGPSYSGIFSSITSSWWNSLWNFKIPSKVKFLCGKHAWSLRNAVVHNVACDREVDIVDWAFCFINEVQGVNLVRERPGIPVWKPPAPGLYLINTDAALDMVGWLVGFGIVIQNFEGLVMACSSQKLEASYSPQVAEAVALLCGLRLACDTGLYPCQADSDASVVVNWINNGSILVSEIGSVINDIHILLGQARCESVNFVPRLANQVAHMLVKNAFSLVEDMFWPEDNPSCVHAFISAD